MSLLGRLNYISRFIAQLTTTYEPIFKLLKKNVAIKWKDECQEAFDKIKEYLSNPPVLVPPEPENPVDDEYESLNTYFPDEEVNLVEEVVQYDSQIWKLHFDGAVSIKGIRIGAILVSPTGKHYPAMSRLCFFCTNNTAEYEACIMGLNMAINLNVHELLVMGDSNLLIRQAQGDWETRDIKLIPYRQCVEDLSKRFKSIKFRYIARFHNELADALSTLASMLPYPVGATPYLLVYGTEAVIPAEIEIPSLRIIVEAGIEDTEWVKSRLEHLSLIDEKRLATEEAKGKFAPNWQGPYLVNKVLSKGALHLEDIEGKVVDISVNADAVKRYYV
nr:uncharacterized protein LOC117277803 [Nicotiana tomentosiformis]